MRTTTVTYVGATRTFTDMEIWIQLALERKANDGSLANSLGLPTGSQVKLLPEETFDSVEKALAATRAKLTGPDSLVIFNSDGFDRETDEELKKRKDLPLERILVPKFRVEFPKIAAA